MAVFGAVFYYLHQFVRRALCAWLNFTARMKAAYFADDAEFLNGGGRVYGWSNITVLENVQIMDGCFFNCQHGKLWIGKNTIISRNCIIYTWNHDYQGNRLPFDREKVRRKDVYIGKNVWIGMNVIILPGSRIEDGAIVGAGSVVAGQVDKMSIIGAPVATERKKRDQKHYQSLIIKS